MEKYGGTIALAALIIGAFGWLKVDISGLRTEVSELRTEMKTEIRRLDEGQAELRERLAHLEGLMQGIRDSIVSKAK